MLQCGNPGSVSDKLPQETGQVVGVVMDVIRIMGFWCDMHGAHSHVMWRGQVAVIVLEHRRAVRGDASLAENRVKGRTFRLGPVLGVLDAENPVKQTT